MKLLDRLIYDILYRFLIVVLCFLLYPIISRITKWDYPQFIQKTPGWALSLFFIIILFVALLLFYLKRKTYIDNLNISRKVSDFPFNVFGEEDIGFFKNKDVIWSINIPKELPLYNPFQKSSKKERLLNLDLGEVSLGFFPFCPECGGRLEESDTFIGKYLWTCKKCNFKKKNKYNQDYERKKATLELREEFKKFQNSLETDNLSLKKEYLE